MLRLYLSRSPHFYSNWMWPYCTVTLYFFYFRIAYCQDNNCDPKDPLDKFIDELKDKLDISWDKIQDSLLDDQMKETVSLIGSILESLKQFEMPEKEYLTPRLFSVTRFDYNGA